MYIMTGKHLPLVWLVQAGATKTRTLPKSKKPKATPTAEEKSENVSGAEDDVCDAIMTSSSKGFRRGCVESGAGGDLVLEVFRFPASKVFSQPNGFVACGLLSINGLLDASFPCTFQVDLNKHLAKPAASTKYVI
jgi:hypothetical protein